MRKKGKEASKGFENTPSLLRDEKKHIHVIFFRNGIRTREAIEAQKNQIFSTQEQKKKKKKKHESEVNLTWATPENPPPQPRPRNRIFTEENRPFLQ